MRNPAGSVSFHHLRIVLPPKRRRRYGIPSRWLAFTKSASSTIFLVETDSVGWNSDRDRGLSSIEPLVEHISIAHHPDSVVETVPAMTRACTECDHALRTFDHPGGCDEKTDADRILAGGRAAIHRTLYGQSAGIARRRACQAVCGGRSGGAEKSIREQPSPRQSIAPGSSFIRKRNRTTRSSHDRAFANVPG
jgi:hypothetical protein